jgi:hypothetical protein
MPIQWRTLFDTLGVTWTDTGRNTARGWVSIACPWCGDDPSAHLGINEEHGHYHCLRNEDHRGRSPYWLLKGLGVSSRDMDDLLAAHSRGRSSATFGVSHAATTERNDRPEGRVGADNPFPYRWKQLTPAGDSLEALSYLASRHFPDPARTVKEFDLRVGTGKWARRLWFGLRDLAGSVTGFTGRALTPGLSPRYYTESPQPVLYFPRSLNRDHRLALLVEGPIDALRVADVTGRRRNLLIVALCGLSATGHRRLQLTQLAKRVPSFAIALDSGVESVQREKLMNELRAIPALGKITRLKMPAHIDDPGEMTNSEIERWLSTL